jgi:hypothetical protein
MDLPVILAHGELGNWDEVIFIGVAAVFLVFMGISWIRSRGAPLDKPDHHETPTPTSEQAEDRFRLD